MKARKFSRVFLWTAFVFYVCVVFGILFLGGRQGRFPYGSLSEYIRHSVNPIPFKTIFGYVRDVMENRWMLGLAVKNVFGNFILFVNIYSFFANNPPTKAELMLILR